MVLLDPFNNTMPFIADWVSDRPGGLITEVICAVLGQDMAHHFITGDRGTSPHPAIFVLFVGLFSCCGKMCSCGALKQDFHCYLFDFLFFFS